MRDYLEELLAGTEDALDQAEAEWTEGVSPPLPRRSKERPEAAAARRSRREAPGPKRRRDGKNWIEIRAGGAVSIRRDRGGSGVQGAGGTAGRSGRAEDGPVRPPTGGG